MRPVPGPPTPPTPTPTSNPPTPTPTPRSLVALQVIAYYKGKVVNIKADRPQEDVAEQVKKAVAS